MLAMNIVLKKKYNISLPFFGISERPFALTLNAMMVTAFFLLWVIIMQTHWLRKVL